jgi:predicted ATP-dependent serine protease
VRYRRDFNLAIAVALLAAMERMHVPDELVFCGDVDLRGALMEPAGTSWSAVGSAVEGGYLRQDTTIVSGAEQPEFLRTTDLHFVRLTDLREVAEMCQLNWGLAQ